MASQCHYIPLNYSYKIYARPFRNLLITSSVQPNYCLKTELHLSLDTFTYFIITAYSVLLVTELLTVLGTPLSLELRSGGGPSAPKRYRCRYP